jgi:hypothetical protein
MLLKYHEFANGFGAGNGGKKLDAHAVDRYVFGPLRQGEFDGLLRRVTGRAGALQEREHRLKMWVVLAAAEMFGSLQPDDFRIGFSESADFFKALISKRHQPHE